MHEKEKVKSFQIRWNEPLGLPECPYLRRWVLVLFGYSIRVHHWIRSDDKRFFHDHPWSFLTIVLKGSYEDVSLWNGKQIGAGRNSHFSYSKVHKNIIIRNTLSFGDFKFRSAEHKHYVEVGPKGCWTLLFCGRQKRNWGFWIKANQFFRPLRYFSKYGHPPCSEQ